MTEHSEIVSLPREVLDAMLDAAAERGAERALAKIGLDDEHAGRDVRGLRALMSGYRVVRNGFLAQVGKALAVIVLGALVLLAGRHFGVPS